MDYLHVLSFPDMGTLYLRPHEDFATFCINLPRSTKVSSVRVANIFPEIEPSLYSFSSCRFFWGGDTILFSTCLIHFSSFGCCLQFQRFA